MAEITDIIDKTKRYYPFTPGEIRGLIITIAAIAFIISFTEWGDESGVNISLGLVNFGIALLIAGFSFLFHLSAQRITSLYAGLRSEYKPWTFGLIIGVIIAFLTNGKAWVILPGGIILHHLAGHRIGWWRYDIAYVTIGILSMWGSVASVFLAMALKLVNGFVHSPIIDKMILVNVAIAIYTMLPIPALNGGKMFYGSRMIYAFTASFVFAASALMLVPINPWLSIAASIIIAIIFWLMYYIYFERAAWQGPSANMKSGK